MARIWIELEGRELEELAEALAAIDARLARLEAKLDAPNGNGAGWLSTRSAAQYLDTTEIAVRSLERSKKLVASRSSAGRLLFSREALDAYANGGNGR